MTPAVTRAGEPQTLSYSVDGAAKAIGVHRATVWRLIGEGELETYSIGRRKLIPRESIEAFISRRLKAA